MNSQDKFPKTGIVNFQKLSKDKLIGLQNSFFPDHLDQEF